MASTEVEIVNMALNRIGQPSITSAQYTAGTEVVPSYCVLHYAQCRDFLLRMHLWRFAIARATLTATTDDPIGQWTYAWSLPSDYLRMLYWWDDNDTKKEVSLYSYELAGKVMYTNETPVKIKYIKKETTVTNFDPLFMEVLILQLARRLVVPIAGVKNTLKKDIDEELVPLMHKVRVIDKQEQNTVGRGEMDTWNDAMFGFGLRDPTKLGSN
ncbi:MAG: hypothetical protein JXA96_17365 [Sedimentisphaerales bacterium]|nr:hypothetical protein [Sedimentisphaerales bacterium]